MEEIIASHFKDLTTFRKFKSLFKERQTFEFIKLSDGIDFFGKVVYKQDFDIGIYLNDLKEGFQISLRFPNFLEKGFYHRGKEEGFFIKYGGKSPIIAGFYQNGRENGFWKKYLTYFSFERIYSMNREEGIELTFNEERELIEAKTFHGGYEDGFYIIWKNGRKSEEGIKHNRRNQGLRIKYLSNGNIESEEFYNSYGEVVFCLEFN